MNELDLLGACLYEIDLAISFYKGNDMQAHLERCQKTRVELQKKIHLLRYGNKNFGKPVVNKIETPKHEELESPKEWGRKDYSTK